jgi:hypothetical protein
MILESPIPNLYPLNILGSGEREVRSGTSSPTKDALPGNRWRRSFF